VKSKWKILIAVVVVLVLAIGVYASTVLSKKGLITVQTGNVVRQDLTSLVTASGEVKPKNYINIGANAQGELKEILVKEGDRVRRGQLLARIENVQPEADVDAQKATLNSAEADSSAAEAGLKSSDENIRTMQSQIDKDKADLEHAKAEFDRSDSLYKEHLLAKQDYELKKSLITAEVKVDETDIVNVKLSQAVDVTIDAIPNKTFKGHVIEIGNTAILRSTGVAASQSAISSQEAKDFKVVVALDNPPDEIRPGLSCTAKITTATRKNVLTIPIQALTVRQKGQLEPKPADGKAAPVAAKADPVAEKAKKEELQGVFVVAGGKAVFKKVETGITGATDIEVLSGLNEGDQIVTGTYQVIRTILNEAQVKVDNKAPVVPAKS
jgi:HlyD family secretion protein